MNNLKNKKFFQITDDNYIIIDHDINIDLISNSINHNTSILYFDEDFYLDNPLFNMFLNKTFDKLILITSKKPNIKNTKRLFISSKINKKIIKSKQTTFIILLFK